MLNILGYIILVLVSYEIANTITDQFKSFLISLIFATSAFLFIYSQRLLPDIWISIFISLAILNYLKVNLFAMVNRLLIALIIKLGAVLVNPVMVLTTYLVFQSSLSVATIFTNLNALFIITTPYLLYNNNQIFTLGILVPICLLSTITMLFYNDISDRTKHLVILFWIILVYFFFGTESLTHYQLITLVSRYFIELIPFMAILLAYLFNKITKSVNLLYIVIGYNISLNFLLAYLITH